LGVISIKPIDFVDMKQEGAYWFATGRLPVVFGDNLYKVYRDNIKTVRR
jgi:hypothetical protein